MSMTMMTSAPEPEVPEKPKRRRFTAEYKLRIIQAAARCTQSGELGALLRREGLYSSHLTTWRQQSQNGTLRALAPKKRGPKKNPLPGWITLWRGWLDLERYVEGWRLARSEDA